MGLQVVPNRNCGPCNACCRVHAILDPDMKKLPNVLCAHWQPAIGCSIYELRPKTCRGHLCAWRLLPQFDDSWRPDLSNIYVELRSDPPEQYRHVLPDAPFAFKFTLLGELTPNWLGQLAITIAALIANDVPVILAVAAPPGHFGSQMLLNPTMKQIAAEAGQPFMELFALALHTLYSAAPQKITFAEIKDMTVIPGQMAPVQAFGALP